MTTSPKVSRQNLHKPGLTIIPPPFGFPLADKDLRPEIVIYVYHLKCVWFGHQDCYALYPRT